MSDCLFRTSHLIHFNGKAISTREGIRVPNNKGTGSLKSKGGNGWKKKTEINKSNVEQTTKELIK